MLPDERDLRLDARPKLFAHRLPATILERYLLRLAGRKQFTPRSGPSRMATGRPEVAPPAAVARCGCVSDLGICVGWGRGMSQ